MIEYLSGALTLAYVLAGFYFLRFWSKVRDFLFLSFAIAFWLFALNLVAVELVGAGEARSGYLYILRILGFALILYAIVGRNIRRKGG